jgi:hypothetical protein
MNNDSKTRQQVIEKIKKAADVLVTVSNDPSVDGLSAALGLTLLLNKLNKHATAIFSGQVPPAITFLDPEKTFENTIDSLRDFIIALDKEKADHLRYKIDGDVVKIFITPYRTTITKDDLEFSQGDYNVELVLALGVDNQDHLDSALAAHGQILDDATVITISAGEQVSKLGSLDWHDEQASSLCEMLVGLADSLKSDKPLVDEQIATAFLTGIVAATDRFSNTRTSSRVMTMAAQLMSAGANQQLIAAKLQEAHEIPTDEQPKNTDQTAADLPLVEGESTKIAAESTKPVKENTGGELTIDHKPTADTLDQVAAEVALKRQKEATTEAKKALSDIEASTETEKPETAVPNTEPTEPAAVLPGAPLRGAVQWSPPVAQSQVEPSLGGTLNATTEQAEQDKKREEIDLQNRTILNHDYIGSGPALDESPINSAMIESKSESSVDPFKNNTLPADQAPIVDKELQLQPKTAINTEPAAPPSQDLSETPATPPTLADLDAQHRQPKIDLPLPPPVPDFSTLTPPPVPPEPELSKDIFVPEQPPAIATPAPMIPPVQPQPDDPTQFRIPSQR